jgi:hypothetical protein
MQIKLQQKANKLKILFLAGIRQKFRSAILVNSTCSFCCNITCIMYDK